MTSSWPYLIRGLYEWIVDNSLTPYITVNADVSGVIVPREHVQDGKITLDISSIAAKNLRVGNDAVEFKARFSGRIHDVYIPAHAILAIFSRENGKGMKCPEEDPMETRSTPTPPPQSKPHLTLVEKEKK
jgi:stringent starvation protein B